MEGAALAFATLCLCLAIIVLFIGLYRLDSEDSEGFSLQSKFGNSVIALAGMYVASHGAYVFLAI